MCSIKYASIIVFFPLNHSYFSKFWNFKKEFSHNGSYIYEDQKKKNHSFQGSCSPSFFSGNYFLALCSKMLVYTFKFSIYNVFYAIFLSTQKNTKRQISLLNTHPLKFRAMIMVRWETGVY